MDEVKEDNIEKELRALQESISYEDLTAEKAENVDFFGWRPMPYQQEWFDSEAQIKLILAGNQVGKTLCLIIKVLTLALGILPYSLGGSVGQKPVRGSKKGIQILLAGESAKAVKKTFVTKLEHFIRPEWVEKTKMGKEGYVEEYRLVTGTTITIWSYSQHSSTWEGPQWNFAGFDEPPKKSHFTATQRGTMKRQGEIWVTATPLKEEWMEDDLIEPAQNPASDLFEQADYFRVDMHSNCKDCNGGYIPHDRIMSYLATLTPEERAAREHGMFLARTGLEFAYVREDTHVVPDTPISSDMPVVEVIDPSTKRGIWLGHFVFLPDGNVNWFQAEHIPDGPFAYMCRSIHRYRGNLPSRPKIAICDQRGLTFMSNKDQERTWFDEFRKYDLTYVRSVEALHETLHDWLKPLPNGRPKLCLTKTVATRKEGPLWATQRYRYSPLDSAKKRYGQKGKDWIDLMRYLAGQPGLTYQRLCGLQSDENRAGPVRAYQQQRPRPYQNLVRQQARLRIGANRVKRLRRRGWSL